MLSVQLSVGLRVLVKVENVTSVAERDIAVVIEIGIQTMEIVPKMS